MKFLKYITILCCSCIVSYTYAQEAVTETKPCCNDHSCCKEKTQAPAGIMTDHVHDKGTWMVSYSFMSTNMAGNRMNDKMVDDSKVYQTYAMLMVMYGLTNKITIMGMFDYMSNNMSMSMNPGAMQMMNMPGMQMGSSVNMNAMSTKTSGLADTKLSALYSISSNESHRFIGCLGFNIPNGSINRKGATMLGDNQQLAYPMQLGTGTFGILPSLTYVREFSKLTWGAEAGANINLGSNANGYRWQPLYNATSWVGYKFLPFISGSLRVEGTTGGGIIGNDKDIAVLMYNDPNANAANYGGERVTMYAGINLHSQKKNLSGFSLLAEYGRPVDENLQGTQMALHDNIIATLKYMF